MTETNWAGYSYPPMLRASIERAKTWDMQHVENRRGLLRMRLRYWLWWKWVPIPSAVIGGGVGVAIGFSIISWIIP